MSTEKYQLVDREDDDVIIEVTVVDGKPESVSEPESMAGQIIMDGAERGLTFGQSARRLTSQGSFVWKRVGSDADEEA